MTTTRTPIRNDDARNPRDLQRPINEAVRGVQDALAQLPRREMRWVRVTQGQVNYPTAFELVQSPGYAVASVQVHVALDDAGSNLQSGAMAVKVTPLEVDGRQMLRLETLYGITAATSCALLLEFVEDTSGGQNRSNPTEGGT
jgi:hypothetical protein